jgi:hypothetical protein
MAAIIKDATFKLKGTDVLLFRVKKEAAAEGYY